MLKTKSKGFSIVDSLVAMAVVSVSLFVLAAIYPTIRLSKASANSIVASAVAQAKLEQLRSVPYESVTVVGETPFSDPGLSGLSGSSATYTISDHDFDGDGEVDQSVKKIVVRVGWFERGSVRNRELRAFITPVGLSR